LAKGAEAFTKTAGEMLGGKIVELSQAVADKLKGDSYAEQTLARAKEMPESEDRQSALKGILTEKMNANSGFAEVIGKLLDEVQLQLKLSSIRGGRTLEPKPIKRSGAREGRSSLKARCASFW
jgi:hypothetical protein